MRGTLHNQNFGLPIGRFIPAGAGNTALDDLEPAVTLANALTDREHIPRERIVFALNQVGSSQLEITEARAYLEKTRFDVLEGAIAKKPAFSRAHDLGLSMIEAQYKGPKDQAVQLIRAAIARFEQLTSE